METPVIVAMTRTPIGRANKGSLRDCRPDDLGALVVKSLVDSVESLDPSRIDDVIVGTAAPERQQGLVVGRIITRLAGLPDSVPGMTVSRACASSLQAVQSAAHAVRAGAGSIYVAGGVESVSKVPGIPEPDDLNPRLTDPKRADYLDDMYVPMLKTAENVAARFGVSRERMDEFALLSQQRAARAQAEGHFAKEITAVLDEVGEVLLDEDECIRGGTTLEGLRSLKPVIEGGVVTPGNACPLNDGAAALLVMSETEAAEQGLSPLAKIVDSTLTGLDPQIMGVGPIDAVRKLLDRNRLSIKDIDLVELNEAFAAQVLAVADELEIDIAEQLNPFGGAIALGHPFGMTGVRLVGTLINGLQSRDQNLGIATLCIGGGQGMAMLIERVR